VDGAQDVDAYALRVGDDAHGIGRAERERVHGLRGFDEIGARVHGHGVEVDIVVVAKLGCGRFCLQSSSWRVVAPLRISLARSTRDGVEDPMVTRYWRSQSCVYR